MSSGKKLIYGGKSRTGESPLRKDTPTLQASSNRSNNPGKPCCVEGCGKIAKMALILENGRGIYYCIGHMQNAIEDYKKLEKPSKP